MSAEKPTHRHAAVQIVTTLRNRGHAAYLAGGCVRDELLGVEPKDYDVATDAPPEAVKKLFPKSRYVGEAFGVVLVHLDGYATEVATFRTEWGYVDGRRPTQVHFSDAQHDALRRDFTINGLFEDPLTQDPAARIIDFVGGQEDLRAGVIRAIGHPDERFAEDYLRMLRAVRFAARLGFSIHADTASAIRARADHLRRISRERIGQEVMWMLSGQPSNPCKAATWIQELGLDSPTLNEPAQHTPVTTLQHLSRAADYPTALAAWMLDRHVLSQCSPQDAAQSEMVDLLSAFVHAPSDKIISRWRKSLCLSNDHRDALKQTIETLAAVVHWPQLPVSSRKRLLARDRWPQVAILLQALAHLPGMDLLTRTIDQEAQPLLTQGVAPAPWVDGHDLIGLGLAPGPEFAHWLDAVYDAQLEGELSDRDDALAWLNQRIKNP